ncbi:MAG: GH3 family acyl-acid amido synthetase [Planctomycetota bacterium]|jgi:hypothetical protein
MSNIEEMVEAGVAKRVETLRHVDRSFRELQRRKLLAIVRNCADTEFGRTHRFKEIGSIADFQRAVPLSVAADYDKAWKRIAGGARNVLFPEPVHAFALSSGTTGEPKTVPLNKALVRGLKRAIGHTTAAHMARAGSFALLRGYALQMAAPPEVRRLGDVPVGYITGIMGEARTYPFHNIGIPRKETLDLMDWNEKYRIIEERYGDHDVRMIFGIPGYMLALFDRLMRNRGVRSLASVWPHLELVVTSGTSLRDHRAHLEALCPGAQLREMYLATEAAVAFQPGPEPGLMPMVEDVFCEFVPEERWEEEDPPRFVLGEVDTGARYVVILTTPSGLYAYSPGDVVRFVQVDPPRMVVEGRHGNVINLAAEKLDEVQATQAVDKAGLRITSFTVCPAPGAKPGHEWVMEFDGAPPADAAERLDAALCEMNPLYRHLREGDLLFARPLVTRVRTGTFAAALRRRPGQGKILHVYQDRAMRDELRALQES